MVCKVLAIHILCTVLLATVFYRDVPAETRDDVLRLLYWQAPTVFHPHLAAGNKDKEACRITYEPLATYDEDGTLIPVLAREIPDLENKGLAQDGKSVIWKLKSNVKWSDGHPFTAHDVSFTWEFIRDPDNNAISVSAYKTIENVEVMDDLTVKIVFTAPNPAWTIPFVGTEGMILPRHIFEGARNSIKASKSKDSSSPLAGVGTGPYYMTGVKIEGMIMIGDDVVKMVNIMYASNPFFREQGKPYFKRIELRGGGDSATAARAVLKDGSSDFAWNLQSDEHLLKEFQKGGTGRVYYPDSPLVERVLINFTDPGKQIETGERSSQRLPHPFFNNRKVRQAFSHAIDRQAVASLYGESGVLTSNILVSPSKYNSPNTEGLYPFDLERAAALLDEAGWKNIGEDGFREKDGMPLRVVFQTSINPIRQKTQDIIKKALESIGVDVRLKMIDAGLFFGNDPTDNNCFRRFYADMQEYAHGNTAPDPTDYVRWWTCDQTPRQENLWSFRNIPGWCNPEYDALHQRVSVELEPAKRREYFIQLNDLLVKEVVMIPLVIRRSGVGLSLSLKGVKFTPWNRNTWDIKDWYRE